MILVLMVFLPFAQAKLETKALKAKRPGFTDERYNETSYYHEPENGEEKDKTDIILVDIIGHVVDAGNIGRSIC